jgi:histidine triad (HIT) family protein
MAIELPELDPCPFCRDLRGDAPADPGAMTTTLVARFDLAAALLSPIPLSRGAVLVVPTRHSPTILDLTDSETEALAHVVRRVARAVLDAFDPSD